MSFLDGIVANTVERVAERRARTPIGELRARLRDAPPVQSFYDAVAKGFGVIAEHKRRSPSGGAMDLGNVAAAYDTYATLPWVVAVSVLTDEDYFDGRIDDLGIARARTKKPILRKDFVVDEYQVVEARAFGADAILLMASVLAADPPKLRALHAAARDLGLDVLVEIGMTERRIEDMVQVIPEAARLVGVNARQFATAAARGSNASGDAVNTGRRPDPSAKHDLPTDVRTHAEYRRLVPAGKLAVAESGIHTADELRAARDAGYHAALVGTAFLKGPKTIQEIARDLSRAFA
jgi:indole-3-glycerol phosphate synthase